MCLLSSGKVSEGQVTVYWEVVNSLPAQNCTYIVVDEIEIMAWSNSCSAPTTTADAAVGLVQRLMNINKCIHHSFPVTWVWWQAFIGDREVGRCWILIKQFFFFKFCLVTFRGNILLSHLELKWWVYCKSHLSLYSVWLQQASCQNSLWRKFLMKHVFWQF